MSDPLEHLHHFDTEGLDVNPLPASEVRRRGNRMRRRNNAIAVVGGLVAVAIVAVPLAMTAGGDDHAVQPADPGPTRTTDPSAPTAWVRRIPEGFPLTQGFPETNGNDGSPVTVTTPTDVEVFPPCLGYGDQRTPPTPAVDRASVTYLGESEDRREAVLALYDDAATASGALKQIETDVAGCPTQTHQGTTTLFDSVPSDYGDESFTWTVRLRQGGELSSELYVVQNVRVGNAIYALSYYGTGGANQEVIDHTARLMALNSAPVISSMCVFTAEPCDAVPTAPASSPPGGTGEGAVAAIPADFPLLDGYPDDSTSEGGSYGIQEPTRVGKSLVFEACGTRAPAPDGVEQLSGGWTNPEDFRHRQLTTFATREAATAFVDGLLQVYRDCPTEDTADGYRSLRTVLDGDLGDQSASATIQYTLDGGMAPGLDITTVVRVGRAVLVATTYGEGIANTDQELADQAASDAAAVTTLVDAMCPWTRTGC